MATGMAIMGFGGGALIASPLSDQLMKHFASPNSTGVAQTWLVLGLAYLVFMIGGAFGYRIPAAGWKPLSSVMLRDPLRVACPVTFNWSKSVPAVVPPSSMPSAPVAPWA